MTGNPYSVGGGVSTWMLRGSICTWCHVRSARQVSTGALRPDKKCRCRPEGITWRLDMSPCTRALTAACVARQHQYSSDADGVVVCHKAGNPQRISTGALSTCGWWWGAAPPSGSRFWLRLAQVLAQKPHLVNHYLNILAFSARVAPQDCTRQRLAQLLATTHMRSTSHRRGPDFRRMTAEIRRR
jgi:hypothetical protein